MHIVQHYYGCHNNFADDANSSVNMHSEHYGTRDVTVTVSVKIPQRYASYNVSITHHNRTSTFDGITNVIQVTLLYNVEYNLSVEVKVLCRANTITSFYLHYGEMNVYLLCHS